MCHGAVKQKKAFSVQKERKAFASQAVEILNIAILYYDYVHLSIFFSTFLKQISSNKHEEKLFSGTPQNSKGSLCFDAK